MKTPDNNENPLFPVTLILPYTDPIDWDRFQEKIRTAIADCGMASADLRRRPRFEVVLNPVGAPTPTAVKSGFQPDRTSTAVLSDSKEGEGGTAFLAAVTALRRQTATWDRISTRLKSRDIAAETPIEVGCSLRAVMSHLDGPDHFYMQRLDAAQEIQRLQADIQVYYKKVGVTV